MQPSPVSTRTVKWMGLRLASMGGQARSALCDDLCLCGRQRFRFPLHRSRVTPRINKKRQLTADRLDTGANWRVLALSQAHHRSRLSDLVGLCFAFPHQSISDSVKNGNALSSVHNQCRSPRTLARSPSATPQRCGGRQTDAASAGRSLLAFGENADTEAPCRFFFKPFMSTSPSASCSGYHEGTRPPCAGFPGGSWRYFSLNYKVSHVPCHVSVWARNVTSLC